MLLPQCHINYDYNSTMPQNTQTYTKPSCYMPLKVMSINKQLMNGLTLPGTAVQFHPHTHCPRV